ncbi:MAG: nucleoside diphosphate kinase regulator [Bdellovibrionaceae bacterium]|nr:nucleoside diphosphate kinase regulator [Pseudobdellovibrionaceae bacterium]
MENADKIILSQDAFQKISALLAATSSETAELLEEELQRAMVVPDDELPSHVVAINSLVTFVDLESGKETQVTLVYPHEASIDDHKVSVIAPLGAALIGLSVGQSIQWPMPNGKQRRLQVTAVTPAPI